MPVDKTTRLFFDASCLFLAANTPFGGSAYLVSVCSKGYMQAIVSPDVLIEAERNILDKLDQAAFNRYRDMITSTPFLVISTPSERIVNQYASVFFEDAHVIASALAAQSDFLLTVDQRFERRVKGSNLPIIAISPKDFLDSVFPDHPDFSQIRQQR